jgi:hypothetical protein
VVIKQGSRAHLPVQLGAKAQNIATEIDEPFWAVFQGFGEMHPEGTGHHSFVRPSYLSKKEGRKEGVVIKQDSRALLPVQLEAKAQCMATEMDLPFWAVFQGVAEMHPEGTGHRALLSVGHPSHQFVEEFLEGRKEGRKE